MSDRTSMRIRIVLISIFILVYVVYNGVPGILYYSLLLICFLSLVISAVVCIKHRDDKKLLMTELISDGIIIILIVIFVIKLIKLNQTL